MKRIFWDWMLIMAAFLIILDAYLGFMYGFNWLLVISGIAGILSIYANLKSLARGRR